jgi:hypothetical protein
MSVPLPPASIFDQGAGELTLPSFDQYMKPSCLEISAHLHRAKEEGEAWAALEALQGAIRGLK